MSDLHEGSTERTAPLNLSSQTEDLTGISAPQPGACPEAAGAMTEPIAQSVSA